MPTRLSVFGVRIPEKAIQRRSVLPMALLVIAVLAAVEWHFRFDFSLGVLYTIPVLLASAALNRWQIVMFGLFAALARAPFTPSASALEGSLKFAMAAIAYTCTGLLLVEMSNSRRRLLEAFAKVQMEQDLRRRAQEQLRMLAESSPAAILTLDARATVLAANRAADDMIGVAPGALVGTRVDSHFPMFQNALTVASSHRPIRTSVTGWARRANDQHFPIQAWFSVYGTEADRCLAAIVVDMSEEVRDRERENFQHQLDYNRLLASAVSHEIRNLCAAISVVCSNLAGRADLHGSADFVALTRLVGGLTELASLDLRSSGDATREADLRSVLDHLRVVIDPDWEEIGGAVTWEVPANLPPVAASAHGLLQILLNLCQNSLRASVAHTGLPQLAISVACADDDVVVTVTDNGPGVAAPEQLFHLHPPGSSTHGSGLGLYISRELARSVGGDLQHVRSAAGATFRVIVPQARQQLGGQRAS